MGKLFLPDIINTPMFVDGKMNVPWVEFFRMVYERSGGVSNITLNDTEFLISSDILGEDKTNGPTTKKIDEIERVLALSEKNNSLIKRIADIEQQIAFLSTKMEPISLYKKIDDLEKYVASLDTQKPYDKIISELQLLTATGIYDAISGVTCRWYSRDLDVDAIRLPLSNSPAEDYIDEFLFHRYDRATEEHVKHNQVIPMNFVLGAYNIRGCFNFVVENPPVSPSADEAVVMGFELKFLKDGDVFDFTAGTASGTVTEVIAADETALIRHTTPLGYVPTSSVERRDSLLVRFYRDATNPDDTYDNETVAADNDAWVYSYNFQWLGEERK